VQADLAVFRRLGAEAACCVTAVTAQDERGVQAVFPLPLKAVEAQLLSAYHRKTPDCAKIGMLWSPAIARAVARQLRARRPRVVVIDPVLAASAGGALAQPGLQVALEKFLFPLCDVITPNIPEAERFLGGTIAGLSDAQAAALELSRTTSCAVILKGGHLSSVPGTDLVCLQGQVALIPPDPSFPADFHGSGCVFSSALATFLSQGQELVQAARSAKVFVGDWATELYGKSSHALSVPPGR
jgi:hydroxymethylpyrimidine/phosphomethylpyrimidine kinase